MSPTLLVVPDNYPSGRWGHILEADTQDRSSSRTTLARTNTILSIRNVPLMGFSLYKPTNS